MSTPTSQKTGLPVTSIPGPGSMSSYTSADTAPDASSTAYTFVHGLGVAPTLVTLWLVCTTNDTSTKYVVGDLVHHTAWFDPVDVAPSFGISSNATSVIVTVAGAPMVGNETNFVTIAKILANGFQSPSSWNNFKLRVNARV